jgi:hypothetical protein
MDWQKIAHKDPFLSGSIAARGWEWWMDFSAESEADSVGLAGEPRKRFLAGWQDELDEQAVERKTRRDAEYDEMSAGWEKGDPAAR